MSELYIKTENVNGRTVVSDSYFTAPFKITQPFYNNGVSEIMIMQASAGILDGDSLNVKFDIGSGSHTAITGQSYTKLFKMDRYGAVQHTKINVGENSTFYYLPCPRVFNLTSIMRTRWSAWTEKLYLPIIHGLFRKKRGLTI